MHKSRLFPVKMYFNKLILFKTISAFCPKRKCWPSSFDWLRTFFELIFYSCWSLCTFLQCGWVSLYLPDFVSPHQLPIHHSNCTRQDHKTENVSQDERKIVLALSRILGFYSSPLLSLPEKPPSQSQSLCDPFLPKIMSHSVLWFLPTFMPLCLLE